MFELNYALYRQQMLTSTNNITEKEIYTGYMSCAISPDWHIHTEPVKGENNKYHFIYISVRDDGMIYIGKHSTEDLNDGYQGSGTDLSASKQNGHKFVTTPLEFFKYENDAYTAEEKIVNKRFILESSGLVLNRTIGGKGYPHSHTKRRRNRGRKHQNRVPWDRVTNDKGEHIQVGTEFVCIWNNKVAKVVDVENRIVEIDGERTTLTGYCSKINNGDWRGNEFFSWDGKILANLAYEQGFRKTPVHGYIPKKFK